MTILDLAVKDLTLLYEMAQSVVDKQFPNLKNTKDPRDYRISIQSAVSQLLRLMELKSERY